MAQLVRILARQRGELSLSRSLTDNSCFLRDTAHRRRGKRRCTCQELRCRQAPERPARSCPACFDRDCTETHLPKAAECVSECRAESCSARRRGKPPSARFGFRSTGSTRDTSRFLPRHSVDRSRTTACARRNPTRVSRARGRWGAAAGSLACRFLQARQTPRRTIRVLPSRGHCGVAFAYSMEPHGAFLGFAAAPPASSCRC